MSERQPDTCQTCATNGPTRCHMCGEPCAHQIRSVAGVEVRMHRDCADLHSAIVRVEIFGSER